MSLFFIADLNCTDPVCLAIWVKTCHLVELVQSLCIHCLQFGLFDHIVPHSPQIIKAGFILFYGIKSNTCTVMCLIKAQGAIARSSLMT